MILPRRIASEDVAVIVSPAGHVDADAVEAAKQIMEEWNLKVRIAPNALGMRGRFSGTIENRVDDFQQALDDPRVRVIFCSRGGYGAVHLLDQLDFSKFRKHPKWIIGYSDITAIHLMMQSRGYMSLHGPMAKHFAEEGSNDFAVQKIKDILNGERVEYNIPAFTHAHLNRTGVGRGRLIGGNLAVFCGLIGSRDLPIRKDYILVIEDIGEEPYKVDRYIHQIKRAGIFDKIGGLLVGQFTDYQEDSGMYASLYESIAEAVKEYDFPVFFNFPLGHVVNNYPVVMGHRTAIEVNKEQLILKQQ